MPDYLLTSPDGRKFKVTAPDGASQEQVLSYAREHFSAPEKAPKTYNPTEGMSTAEKLGAGFGKAFVDIGRGVEQAGAKLGEKVGLVSPQTVAGIQSDIDESKSLDSALMNTGAGKFGNVLGGVAATLPAAAIPGVNTYLGAAALGAGLGALQPVATGESRLANTGLGAASGVAGKALGDAAATGLGYVADKLGRVRPQAPATPVTRAMDAGYKLPPSMAVKKPSVVQNLTEGYAGKIKTEQEFSAVNQGNTNRLARRALGLGEGDKISPDEVLAARDEAGKAYNAVKNFQGQFTETPTYRKALDAIEQTSTQSTRKVLQNQQVKDLVTDLRGDMNPDEAIEIVKKLRADSGLNLRAMDPSTRALGRAQKKAAQAVDDLIDEHLGSSGQQGLYAAYRNARQMIAKSYDVEKALNTASGDISAPKLAKLSDKRPLSGDLKTIADFAKSFAGAARDITQKGSRAGPSISPLDVASAGISAAAGHGAPLAARVASGAVALGRPLARKALLSDIAQQSMRPRAANTLEQDLLPRAGELIVPQVVSAYGSQQ